MKEIKSRTPEYLSKDILDEDFIKIFSVFLRLQYFLGSCRVEAKDQFVTSPTVYQKLYTVSCIVVTMILNQIAINSNFPIVEDSGLYILSVCVIWAGFVTYIAITINARFLNGQDNANFFIRLQKLDRLMGFDKDKRLNKLLKRINYFSMCMFLLTCSVVVVSAGIRHNVIYCTFAGALFGQVTSMTELIFCSNLIIYFVVRLRFINSIMKNHLAGNKIKKKTDNVITLTRKTMRNLAGETHDFVSCDTTAYLKELFDCFTVFQNLYRFQLFVFCLKLVVLNLLVFGLILLCVQRNFVDIIEMGSLSIYNIIDICIAIFLGWRLQLFFGEVKETKRVSIAVMAEYTNGHLRDKARKMMKIIEETPPKLSVYDMWEMDAGIFVTIFSLITSLIVTLLQFAFL